MSGFIQTTLVGFIAKDPEHKAVGEKTVTKFSIPVDRTRKGETVTDWFNVEVWDNSFAQKYLKKGSNVIIQGSMTLDKAKEGNGYYVTVKADKINFTPSRKDKSEEATTETAAELF